MNTVPRDAAPASVTDLDRDYLVHPLSELRRDQDRHLVVSGEGIRIHLADGRTLIDGLSGLWNMLIGTRADVDEIVSTLQAAVAQEISP